VRFADGKIMRGVNQYESDNELVFPLEAPCVLVIEDDPRMLSMMRYMLTRGGMDVLVASTAEEGLGLAISALPDVIVCDIALPDLSGLEVLRTLKNWSATTNIPVILTSGSYPLECPGAYTFLPKPFDMTALVSAARHAFQQGSPFLPEAA
jgi:DNA-binding response OmpR family regulator